MSRAPMLLGVCARIAERYDVDVTLLRVAFVVLGLCWGIGLVLYGALWLKLAGVDARRALSGRAVDVWRRVVDAARGGRWREHLAGRAPGIALVLLGTVALLWSFGLLSWLTMPRALALAAVAVGIGSVIGASPPHEEHR